MDLGDKLQDKVAIVTGATSGMGAAIAKLFAAEGARVIISGRDQVRGDKVQKEIMESGGQAQFVQCDVSTQLGNEQLVEKTVSYYSNIDLVVCNAGMLGLGSITDTPPETWRKTIDTNLNSVYYLLRLAIPEMQQRGKGSIVITGSIAAFRAFPNHAAYCASKGALVPLVKQIAVDYAPEIRANLICPGPVDTPLIWSSAAAFPNPDKAVQDAADATLVGRLGTPEDVAKAALFLASDDSSFITGSSITIDGGITTN